jgi:hypothetical protein
MRECRFPRLRGAGAVGPGKTRSASSFSCLPAGSKPEIVRPTCSLTENVSVLGRYRQTNLVSLEVFQGDGLRNIAEGDIEPQRRFNMPIGQSTFFTTR